MSLLNCCKDGCVYIHATKVTTLTPYDYSQLLKDLQRLPNTVNTISLFVLEDVSPLYVNSASFMDLFVRLTWKTFRSVQKCVKLNEKNIKNLHQLANLVAHNKFT